jgi:hypothetical protein
MMSDLATLGGTHGSEIYFERVMVRGYVDVIPYRRFTDMLNQKERTYLAVKKGSSQPAERPPSKQDGQYDIVVPRLAALCATPFQEGTPPPSFNPAEYRIKKEARACFVAFGSYAALGYVHIREGLSLIDMMEIAQEDYLPLTSANLYFLSQPQTPPRSLDLLVVNHHHIEAFYLM